MIITRYGGRYHFEINDIFKYENRILNILQKEMQIIPSVNDGFIKKIKINTPSLYISIFHVFQFLEKRNYNKFMIE